MMMTSSVDHEFSKASMSKIEEHSRKVELLQKNMKNFKATQKLSCPLALHDQVGHSNTTRTKAYKQNCSLLDLSQFRDVIHIHPHKKIAIVEPRVTMEQLLQATLPHHLVPLVLPEFKGITVGGAIMGGAGESSSHYWGCFNDICHSYDIICGNGDLLKASPHENQDLYYGIAGSYGSLGALVSAEIKLMPAQDFVYLQHHFLQPLEAIAMMRDLLNSSHPPIFIDGIIFNENLAVITEGNFQSNDNPSNDIPLFSLKNPLSPWFFQHVKQLAIESQTETYAEKMSLEDYFFRYDLGGFWMGAYLFKLPFLARFISQGILGLKTYNREGFTESEIHRFHHLPDPHMLGRVLLRPFLKSQKLWALLHKAESWIQKRIMIQDFCIPESQAMRFCNSILNIPAIFPCWLCPIKGTRTPQIFAPHFLSKHHADSHLINFGLYGIPAHTSSIRQLTRMLEQKTHAYGGRKALYSHSYYTQEEFWQIYSRDCYEKLRHKTQALGIWHDITDKVLSE